MATETTTTDGGRFDFEDGGAYVGGWSDGRAHGLGLVTGPRGQGEFSGLWEDGFECSGVYLWPSGNAYEGEWRQGKRHGLGTEVRGRWVYRGEWLTGFKGRYGVRRSEASGARYEGTWQLGMQDGAGVETYADGGTYAGCWFHGTRHGLGVRQSVPFGLAAPYRGADAASGVTSAAASAAAGATASVFASASPRRLRESLTSLRSGDEEEAELPAVGGDAAAAAATAATRRRMDESRAGFVLRRDRAPVDRCRPPPTPGASPATVVSSSGSATSLGRAILGRLRKQRSAGDIEQQQSTRAPQPPAPLPVPHRPQSADKRPGRRGFGRRADSLRSSASASGSPATTATASADPLDEVDEAEVVIDPSVTEAYYGEWKQDRRCGFGVAERSDGLKYEGEWEANRRHGYGATTFPDGSQEAGKYKANSLVLSTARRGRLFLLKGSRLRERVEVAAREARVVMADAVKRAENAQSRQQISRQKAELADAAAEKARQDSQLARQIAREYAPNFKQPGLDFLRRRVKPDSLSPTSGRSRSLGAGGRQLTRQRHIEENSPARPSASVVSPGLGLQLPDAVLQVGEGGSRRGSFRRSPAASPVSPNRPAPTTAAVVAPATSAKSPAAAPGMRLSDTVSRLKATTMAVGAIKGGGGGGGGGSGGGAASGGAGTACDRVEPLARVLDIAPTSDHFDQYRAGPSFGRRKRDSGLGRDSSFEDSPNATSAVHSNSGNSGSVVANVSNAPVSNNRGDSDSGLSEVSGGSLSRCRRRTLPSSLAGAPPARPPLTGPPELEDSVHSDHNHLDEQSAAGHCCCCCCCCRAADGNGLRKWPHADPAANQSQRHHYHSQLQHLPARRDPRRPADAESAAAARERRLRLLRMEERRLLGEAEAEAQAEAEAEAEAAADEATGMSDLMTTPAPADTRWGNGGGAVPSCRCCRCVTELKTSAESAVAGGRPEFEEAAHQAPSPESMQTPQLPRGVPTASAIAGDSSALCVAARLSAAAAAHACWRTVQWLRSNARDWFQEHLLLLFVLIINTGLAILVFSVLTNGHPRTP